MPFALLNGLSVYYQWQNNRQPQTLVFINSLGTDLRIWDGVVQALGTSVNILRYDKRGHGLSAETPADQRLTGTMAAFTDDLCQLLDALAIDRCIPVGLSVGGRIALMLADKQPQLVEKLVLCDTAHVIGTRQSWDDRIRAVQSDGLMSLSEAIGERWFPAPFRQQQPQLVQGLRRMVWSCSPTDYVRTCEAIRDADLTDEARRVRVPTLCIVGSEDVATPPALVQSLSALIAGSQFRVLDGSGHIPCVDNPAGLTELILDFGFVADAGGKSPTPNPRSNILYEQGMATRRAVLGDAHVDRTEASKTTFDVDFQRYITENAWGSIWSRPGLTHRERSLITIALLAALGHEDELAMHIRATRNTGATPDDVKEVLLHTAVYAGVPVTNGAMKLAKAIFSQDTDGSSDH